MVKGNIGIILQQVCDNFRLLKSTYMINILWIFVLLFEGVRELLGQTHCQDHVSLLMNLKSERGSHKNACKNCLTKSSCLITTEFNSSISGSVGLAL